MGPLIDISLYTKRTAGGDGPAPHALISQPAARPPLRRLSTELLIYADPSGPAAAVSSALVQGLKALWAVAKADKSEGPAEVLTYHVQPRQCGCVFPLRVTLPLALAVGEGGALARVAGQEDEVEALRELRKRMHERAGVPLNRPAFRTSAALRLALQDGAGSERLQDVHVGMPPSGVQGGKQYLVDGPYLYYHYMQDGYGGHRGRGAMLRVHVRAAHR